MKFSDFIVISKIPRKRLLFENGVGWIEVKRFNKIVELIGKLPGIIKSEGAGYPEGNIWTNKPVYCVFIEQQGSTKGLAFLGKLMSRRYYGLRNKGCTLEIDEVTDLTNKAQILLTFPLNFDEIATVEKILEDALNIKEWPLGK